MAVAICRFLATRPNGSAKIAPLADTVSPESLPTARATGNRAGSLEFDRTLAICTNLEVLERSGGKIRLSEGVFLPDVNLTGIDPVMSRVFRHAVLEHSSDDSGGPFGGEAGDLARAVAWFLAQDPWSGVGRWSSGGGETVETLQNRIPEKERKLFNTQLRWQSFRRWSTFIGLARSDRTTGETLLIPDPTAAIRNELPTVFGADSMLEIGEFMVRVAAVCPVLDGGALRQAVTEEYEELVQNRGQDSVSHSMALALDRLETLGVISLIDAADAAKKFRVPNAEQADRRRSHIVWKES